mgnify:CR=1 FL=1
MKKYCVSIDNLANAKLELTDPMIVKKPVNFQFSPQQQKVISLLKYKGSATLNDIARLMKLSQTEAEKAARRLLNIREFMSANIVKANPEEGILGISFLKPGVERLAILFTTTSTA